MIVQPGSNVVVDIDVLPPPPPSRPRTRSRGRSDGYMHEEVDIAPMGRTAMSMALRNLNLMRALPKEQRS